VNPNRSSEIEFMYAPIPTTITAGVTTYSIVSATPVVNPPHGPSAVRENEYAPPGCGHAGDISEIE
jgi:hypothetical protein